MEVKKEKKKIIPRGEKKVYEFIGIISGKIQDTDYHTNETVYRLSIKENEDLKKLTVYQRKVSSKIWEDVININYFDKRYAFFCEKITTAYHLRDWKEIEKR